LDDIGLPEAMDGCEVRFLQTIFLFLSPLGEFLKEHRHQRKKQLIPKPLKRK
jgi:hypothetical protein